MKYKYTGTEEQLIETGFETEDYCPNFVRERKTKKSNYVFVTINKNTKQIETTISGVYETNFKKTNYFADLIEKGLVEEQND